MKNIHYINAGAGSGKTYTLTAKLVELLSSGKCKPSEVILTTFTELAATEFRQKAYDALVKANCYDKAAGLAAATIGTVHSVALKYVQKYWYILGMGSRLNVLSEEDKKVFISEAVARAINDEDRRVFKRFNEIFTRKGYRNDDPWIETLKKMIEKADTFGITELQASKEYSLKYTEDFFTEDGSKLDPEILYPWLKDYLIICKEGDKSGKPYQDEIDKIDRCIEKPKSYPSLIDIKGMLDNPKRASAKKCPGYEELLWQIDIALRDNAFQKPLRECIETVFSLVVKVNQEWDRYKVQNGLIEYNDMERYFIQLLDNELVREDIRSSVKYVFVDEFQDSNPVQIEIFKRLSELVTESYWVGDPKQSIYGFRGSAPEIVMELTSIIRQGGEGLVYESLPYSWRSSEKIVEFDSSIALRMFTDPERYPDPALRHAPNGNNTVVEDPIQHWDCFDGISPEKLAQKIIKVLSTTDLKPSDIAILCRKNDDVTEIAGWLKSFGLPVSSPETFLASKAETQLVFAVLRYMLMKDDHTKAELSMLIDGTSLEEILLNKESIIGALDDSRLMEITERVKHQGVPDIVDTIIDELDIRGLCSRWGDNDNRQSNLDILQSLAREYDRHCIQLGIGSSLQGYITYVSTLEVMPKTSNSDSGIKILSYHGCKGLEWRMVILMDLKKNLLAENILRPRFIFDMIIEKLGDGKSVLRYIPDFRPSEMNGVPKFIMELPHVAIGFEDYIEKCREENKRLLYVGFTRARDYIVTLSSRKDKYSWLSQSGLIPAELKALVPGEMKTIWDPGVPESLVLDITTEDRERYVAEAETTTWYRPAVELTEREHKFVTPSSLPVKVSFVKGEAIQVAEPIPVEGEFDPKVLGTCIHNFFAVCEPGTDCSGKAARLISNFRLQNVLVSPEALDASFQGLHSYMESTFGKAVAEHHELPYTQKLPNGQTVNGEIDYVWELPDRKCVIVDFKNSNAGTDYSAQLHLYRKAMEQAGWTVLGTYLFYALKGNLNEVKTTE